MIVFYEPPKEKKFDLDAIDIDKLVEESLPALEWSDNDFFNKYGHYFFGISDGYRLNKDYKEKMSEIDKLKFIAFCSTYWLYKFEYWYNMEEYKNYKIALKGWAEINPDFLITLKSLEDLERS